MMAGAAFGALLNLAYLVINPVLKAHAQPLQCLKHKQSSAKHKQSSARSTSNRVLEAQPIQCKAVESTTNPVLKAQALTKRLEYKPECSKSIAHSGKTVSFSF